MKTFAFSAVSALVLSAGLAAAQDYPAQEIQSIIQWGAGGSTDTVMRSVTPHAEEILGGTVVKQNMTGAVGTIALNCVAEQDADGYNILMGAENPMLNRVMASDGRDYGEIIPINLLARGTPILVTRPDAPFDSYESMLAHIAENPGEVRFGSTGPGGLPSVIPAMMDTVKGGLDVNFIPCDGDGPALTALQGGANDVMPAVLGASIEFIRAGNLVSLAIFDTEASPFPPDVPTAVSLNEGFATYLPWGPFFGVFVREGTLDDVVASLTEAYAGAVENADFAT